MERESEQECRECMHVCVCLYVCVSAEGRNIVCVRERETMGGGREGGGEASRKWGWRGRVRISNRMRIEKYEAQESREPASLTFLPPPV